MATVLWIRLSVRWIVVYAPAVAHLDRFSRHSGRVHARQSHGLLRNSRRVTYVQQQYAIDDPLKFKGYEKCCWGITASDGPGPDTIKVDGIERQFFGNLARGVPYGPDDGTIAPWAVVASLPFGGWL